MGIFEEGKTDCVRELLRPAERVIKQGLDIYIESFSRREKLWIQIEDNYNQYLDGKCGDFLPDLDRHFRSKFEGAMAILAWSFWYNRELYPPAQKRYQNKEIQAVDRILRYNVFEIMGKDDILRKLVARDEKLLSLLKDYYLGVDKWIGELLEDPEIKLALRHFLKNKWDSYKGKVNEALSEAVMRFDWFRPLMVEWEKQKKEEIEAIETLYQKQISRLRNQMEEMRTQFEKEKEELRKRLETAKDEEISRLIREKEEMKKRFEEERQRLVEEISKMKDEEARKMLEEELDRMQKEMLAGIRAMEDEIRRKELQLKQREMELRKKELELSEKESEVEKKIREIMAARGKIEKGSRFVRRDEARIMEMNFIGRMKGRLRNELRILGKTFRIESLTEKATFDTGIFAGKLSERDLKNIPENTALLAILREKKFFGKKETLLLKAIFCGRPEKYAEVGFDTDPAELADVNALLVDARRESFDRVILLLASPTGFEHRVKDYISSTDFHRNFVSEKVSLALLDLESGELTINPNDKYARAFEPFLRLERDEELMSRIKSIIEEKLSRKGYVRLEDMLENATEDVIKRAFHELAREKGYATKFIDGVGYILVKEGFL
ncbi:hypothetical protein JCM16138_14510 [Thermococcus atlanticus]